MNPSLTEADVENIAIHLFEELGYYHSFGPDISPDGTAPERTSYNEPFLPNRLNDSLSRLNPTIPSEALEDAFKKVIRTTSPSLVGQNHAFHKMLIDGVDVSYRNNDRIVHDKVRLIDFNNPENNDWLIVNQFTIIEEKNNRRPDLLIFVNGLPLGIIELKNPSDETTTIWTAFKQIQTYKHEIPGLFGFNCIIILSDGLEARIGSLTADKERFMVWKTIEGEDLSPFSKTQMEVLIKGVFQKDRFLKLIRYYSVFENDQKGSFYKKIAGYHQFHAVENAIESTIQASKPRGDRRVGVIWHTQGSGKSLTMAFYAGRIILDPRMENPTIVVLTDRNDLDNQLFTTFSNCSELIRQAPVQAESREDLRKLLQVASGGVVFTTIQKFFPEDKYTTYPMLSERKNIVVIADEAHRSQYDFIDGFARHMRDALPHASFIGFTGTPIELTDKNTKAVFGEYISIYDIQRAVEDGATVPIYYESRLAQLQLKDSQKPLLDTQFEEVTESQEESEKEKLKTKWAALEALVGAEERIKLIAQDIVKHWETRLEAMMGKAMIVCMSRRICVDLYNEITKLRPEWHSEDDAKGILKIVMTGSATDKVDWQIHIRNKARRQELADRFKDPKDPFQIVIVRDMWLTGFDAPCLHTMYLDKPMAGHGLMQAIARVNRVFKDKPGGLVVDYIGLADSLKNALKDYVTSGGKGSTAIDKEEAVAVMMEKYDIICDLFHGFDWSIWKRGTPKEKLDLIPSAQDHILRQENGKINLLKSVTELSQAFALAVPHEKTTEIRDDVAFFQLVRSAIVKTTEEGKEKDPEEIDFALKQLVSKAVSSDKVIDVFSAAGLTKPNISLLTDEFLAEIRGMPQKNLAAELLAKLLKDELKNPRIRKNLVQSRSFLELLEQSIQKYRNRSIETAEVIKELIELAIHIREAGKRGDDLGLNDDEIAFYDALETNDSAVKILGDETLKKIAMELVKGLKSNLKVDWTQRESVRAQIRLSIKKILKKYKYPPDKQEKAILNVIEQAEELYKDWVA